MDYPFSQFGLLLWFNAFPTNDACRLIAGIFRRLVKGGRPFGEGRADTSRIVRWTNQRKDKMNGDKRAVLKGPAVT